MGFRFRCFGVVWCLLLLALTCLSQEYPGRSGETERASSSTLWRPISGAFRSFRDKVATGVNSIFQPTSKPGSSEISRNDPVGPVGDRGTYGPTNGDPGSYGPTNGDPGIYGPTNGGPDTYGPTSGTPGAEGDRYREIINAPLRCPPDHLVVDGRCRRKLRR